MRAKLQTIPPECYHCGVVDSPDYGNPVESFRDNDTDPQWSNWLCTNCRTKQWHTGTSELSLREFLGQSELQHKYWVEGKHAEFFDAYCEES